MVDSKLLDCFKARPLPVPSPGQTYQPLNESWPELQFLHKVAIPADTSDVSPESIIFGDHSNPFFRVKHEMQNAPERWGVYREDWFGSIAENVYYWYFMDQQKALEFRLWVNL